MTREKLMVQHYECSVEGMEKVGPWGSYVHSDDYDALLAEKESLQKKYDKLVNTIGDLYQMA
jgi:hypothetical protein